jgi:hypothetical protein
MNGFGAQPPFNFSPGSKKLRVERQITPDGKIVEVRTYKETRLDENGMYVTYEEIDVPRTQPETIIQILLKLFFRCINWVIYD